jgi:hypothetical protein
LPECLGYLTQARTRFTFDGVNAQRGSAPTPSNMVGNQRLAKTDLDLEQFANGEAVRPQPSRNTGIQLAF